MILKLFHFLQQYVRLFIWWPTFSSMTVSLASDQAEPAPSPPPAPPTSRIFTPQAADALLHPMSSSLTLSTTTHLSSGFHSPLHQSNCPLTRCQFLHPPPRFSLHFHSNRSPLPTLPTPISSPLGFTSLSI